MSKEWVWTNWVPHGSLERPEGIEPDEVIQIHVGEKVIPPMIANDVPWTDGPPVIQFRRRYYHSLANVAALEGDHDEA